MRSRLISAVAEALFVCAVSLSHASADAQSVQGGGFVADETSGCKIWNPHPEPNETASWSGACVNGFAEGAGRLQWLRNRKPYETDEGGWKAGRQIGRGSQDWTSGRYEGELLDGEPHGQGILTLRTARYTGNFRNGKANGTGTMTSLDGLFQGTWKDGCLVGDKRKIAIGVSSAACR